MNATPTPLSNPNIQSVIMQVVDPRYHCLSEFTEFYDKDSVRRKQLCRISN